MPGAKFCSACGTSLPTDHANSLFARATCAHCRPRFRLARLMLIASFALCGAFGYVVGRNATPRQPFPLLGTPIDPQASASASSTASQPLEANKPMADSAPQAASASSTVTTICGAPTKSGKPCQRKVVGGGYCYQHRDKYGAKQKAPDSK